MSKKSEIKKIEVLAKRVVRSNRTQSNPNHKNLPELIIKLQEEVGELAVAYLMSVNRKGHTKTKREIKENFIEEISDCILILFSITGKAKFTFSKLEKTLNQKFEKRVKVLKSLSR
jgi:NTP pyrophosphatase (non-canonical NTP hydrolase)